MDIRVLRYFLAVAREENITKAAQTLHVSQPTLSKQLIDLEEEVGKQLLIRGKRKTTLTEQGMFLRKRAQEIVNLVDKTESDMALGEGLISGDIYIGGGESEAMRCIAKTAKDLQRKHPQIRYHLFSGNADEVTERIDKGILDLGIVIGPADTHKYNYYSFPHNDHWGILMRKDSPLSQKSCITPKDLLSQPLLCSHQSLAQEEIASWMQVSYDSLDVVATYNLIYNASLMVEEGLGYAFCLNNLINTTGDSQLTFRPLDPDLSACLGLIWKKYQVFPKATQLFISALQNSSHSW